MSAHGRLALIQHLSRDPTTITDPHYLGAACLWYLLNRHQHEARKIWISRTSHGMVYSWIGHNNATPHGVSTPLPSWAQRTSTPFWRCAFAVLHHADGSVPRFQKAWENASTIAPLFHPTLTVNANFFQEAWSNDHTIVVILEIAPDP